MKEFNYRKLKNTLKLYHPLLAQSNRLRTFLAYDRDYYHWVLMRWIDSDKTYRACKGYFIK